MMAMLRQTAALFFDAYRELNARKLFWVVLGLSGLCVLSFAAVGINEQGLVILWWEIPVPFLNTQSLPNKAFFYKFLFFTMGFQIWLTWVATVLALISTASIIPEFVSSGSVDMLLAKPLGRVRLFLTKYLTGLLFAALQVTVFSVAAFLVIGTRGEEWVFSIFLAIPLVVLFFSYLYVVSAFIGLLTRSTIAALLGALGFWFVIFILNATEAVLLEQRITYEQAVLMLTSQRDAQRAALEQQSESATSAEPAPLEAAAEIPASRRNRQRQAQPATPETLETTESNLVAAERNRKRWNNLHSWAFAVKTALPKTGETMGVLERHLISVSEMDAFAQSAAQSGFGPEKNVHGVRISQRTLQREIQKELRGRSVWWIIGTSLVFECAVLGLAVVVFARRDF